MIPTVLDNIERALEGVKHSKWFMSPWHVEEDASAVRNQSDGSYICNTSSDSFAAYIAACNPVAISELLALAREAEALKREIAEKDARIAAAENALDKIVERAAGGTVVPGQSWEMTEKRIRFLEQDIRDIASRARALLSKESADAQG